jgi:hypothetical protein
MNIKAFNTRYSRAVITCAMLLSFAMFIKAQDFRGSISGQVMNELEQVIEGADVTVTNVATNTPLTTKTSDDGTYNMSFLSPGIYRITVEAPGFKRMTRERVEVNIGDKLRVNFSMEVGSIHNNVNIDTDSTPLLDTLTANSGQVIDRRRIQELPLLEGNPIILSRLASGTVATGSPQTQRAFDNNGSSQFFANGAPGGNEYTLDGIPNTGDEREFQRVAYIPPADAVQEYKVVTANYDAQYGHSAGSNIDLVLRTGQNKFNGSLYEFLRNDALAANDYFGNRSGSKRSALRYNRFGGSLGGPVYLPLFGEGGKALYKGRDRTFFFFAFEALKQTRPLPGLFTVPTMAQRQGDFSALLSQGIRIYDPATGVRRADGRVERQPFANNIIPANRISSVAQNFLQYWPTPNLPGDAQGRNNLYSSNQTLDDFHSESFRLDHSISSKNRFYIRYSHNNRLEVRNNYGGEVNGLRSTGDSLRRINDGAAYDHVYAFDPTTVLNIRVGFNRFYAPRFSLTNDQINPASLGFSSRSASFFTDEYLPFVNVRNMSPYSADLGSNLSHIVSIVQPTVIKIIGKHTLRGGYDLRSYRENEQPGRAGAGQYVFSNSTTLNITGQFNNSSPATIGQDFAAFLLGLPTGGRIDRNAFRSNQTMFHSFFIQDDFMVTPKLTLNLGLRYEYEAGTTERYNRNVRGFDMTTSNPIEAAARTAYAASPIPQISANDFRVLGGLMFADANNREFQNGDKNNFQPRVGFAYQINEKTVVRGGYAFYNTPFVIEGVSQHGFSQATNIVPTTDNGLTFRGTLFDPFPDGVAEPAGASRGLATLLGQNLTVLPIERKNARSQRFSLGVQREMPWQVVVEATYIGTRNSDIGVPVNINALPSQYLSRSLVFDSANNNFLTGTVTNPFRGLTTGSSTHNGTTIQRQFLLRPFPQFGDINTVRYDGSSTYDGVQLRAERRFAQGLSILGTYTFSKLIDQNQMLNHTDAKPTKVIGRDDSPHIINVSGIYELPFGRGRKFGNNVNKWMDGFLGGYQLNFIYSRQSGRPLALPNTNYFGDLGSLKTNIDGNTAGLQDRVFDINGFYRQALSNNLRVLPLRVPWLRGDTYHNLDLSVLKNINIKEAAKLQLRFEFINATNTPIFEDPDMNNTSSSFGQVTRQFSKNRELQVGLKLIF